MTKSILNDAEIDFLSRPDLWHANFDGRFKAETHAMIHPFVDQQVKKEQVPYTSIDAGFAIAHVKEVDVISYGLTSFGYDLRSSCEFELFTNLSSSIVDPKQPDDRHYHKVKVEPHEYVEIPPNSYALTASHEYIRMPEDVMGICVGKSTYARCGIIVNVTPIEPGWHGNITIEIGNQTGKHVRVYAMEGIMQLIFFRGEQPGVTYKDKAGKYQGQTGITRARLLGCNGASPQFPLPTYMACSASVEAGLHGTPDALRTVSSHLGVNRPEARGGWSLSGFSAP